MHEAGEQVPGSLSLEELVEGIRELEQEGKTLLDAHEEDLKEDRVDDDLQNRILELQQKDTLSEDEEKELDVLTHLKEALDAEVRRRIES